MVMVEHFTHPEIPAILWQCDDENLPKHMMH